MIWWCDYGTSLGSRLLWNADILATPDCIQKSTAPLHWKRAMIQLAKWQLTLGMKRKIIQCEFPIDCICDVVSICHVKYMGVECVVWGLPHECVTTYWDSREQDFNLSVLPLVFSILGMRHEAASLKSVHSLHDRKTVLSELCLLPFFPSCTVTSSTIFRVKKVPMCLIADTHSHKGHRQHFGWW